MHINKDLFRIFVHIIDEEDSGGLMKKIRIFFDEEDLMKKIRVI